MLTNKAEVQPARAGHCCFSARISMHDPCTSLLLLLYSAQ